MDPLSDSRDEIDRLDKQIVQLLAERMRAVRQIGSFKRENPESPLRDEERERAVFETWAREAEQSGLSAYFVGRVLREILNYSRRDQERVLDELSAGADGERFVRVGYQGVPACYSDLTITKLFASRHVDRVARIGFTSFPAVLDALLAGDVDYALLPIENTIAGSINEVYDLLTRRPVTIVGEEIWPVEHCLVGFAGTPVERLRVIRSHPVALQQCQRFLDGLVGCRVESHHDTSGAAESVAVEHDPLVGAIASEEAARHWGLAVLKREISDQPVNFTRFLLIGTKAEPFDPRLPCRTSLLIAVSHRRGALLECLRAFERQGINMTKLESRPQPHAPWEYLFYVDFEGHLSEPRCAAAVEEMRQHTNHLKVLGSYPRRLDDVERQRIQVEPSAVAEGVAAPPASAPAVPLQADPKLPLCSLRNGQQRTIVDVGGVAIGGDRFVLIAGPCAVESRKQILDAAAIVKKAGALLLRGGAFKPRSSPYAFQGLGFAGLDLLVEAGRAFELPVVTEVLRSEDVEGVAAKADMLQIGARNMQNFALLREVGHCHRPVLLKRGLSATVEELLLAAEYVMAGGNQRVVLCERGIRTFETATRNTLDLSAVPVLKGRTHLPVVVDPSHAAGSRELVVPLALAAAAVGADGLLVEVHPNPEAALCDKEQALTPADLIDLVAGLRPILTSRGRTL
jgi:chorismate mutase / prephenate dehydratase